MQCINFCATLRYHVPLSLSSVVSELWKALATGLAVAFGPPVVIRGLVSHVVAPRHHHTVLRKWVPIFFGETGKRLHYLLSSASPCRSGDQ
jgi:hypothetical protein